MKTQNKKVKIRTKIGNYDYLKDIVAWQKQHSDKIYLNKGPKSKGMLPVAK